jgi:hypothetical protein
LSGTASGTSAATGALAGSTNLGGVSAGAALAAGSLTGLASLGGESPGAGSAAADLGLLGFAALGGTATGIATATAALTAEQPFAFTSVTSVISYGESPTSSIAFAAPANETRLALTRGDDAVLSVTFGQPLSTIEEIWFTVREGWATTETDDDLAVFSASLGEGEIVASGASAAEVTISRAVTRALLFDEYFFDVQVCTNADQILTPTRGQLRIEPDVTRSE